MPPNPPSKRVASPCKYLHFSRKNFNPSRNEILDTPLKTLHKAIDTIAAAISECITSDLRTWMINNKLKINDSKPESRSQFSKVAMANLTVTVVDTEMSSSDKARNL